MLKLSFVCDACGKAVDVKSRDLPSGWARLAQNLDACSGTCFDVLLGKPLPVAAPPSASDEATLPVGKASAPPVIAAPVVAVPAPSKASK